MYSDILLPGICPPSPGFAPCAILICKSVEFTKYSAVTPNLPEATCFIRLFFSELNLAASSPPSPVLLLAPILFIATARVSCASLLIEPRDIAPVANLLTISLAGSTSSIEIASFST